MTTYGPYGNNFQFLMTMVGILINFFIYGGGQLMQGDFHTFKGDNFLGINFLGW